MIMHYIIIFYFSLQTTWRGFNFGRKTRFGPKNTILVSFSLNPGPEPSFAVGIDQHRAFRPKLKPGPKRNGAKMKKEHI